MILSDDLKDKTKLVMDINYWSEDNNLVKNIGNKTSICHQCGGRFEPKYHGQKYCPEHENNHGIIKVLCIDCGKDVKVDARNMTKIRCDECQHERDKQRKRDWWNKNN